MKKGILTTEGGSAIGAAGLLLALAWDASAPTAVRCVAALAAAASTLGYAHYRTRQKLQRAPAAPPARAQRHR